MASFAGTLQLVCYGRSINPTSLSPQPAISFKPHYKKPNTWLPASTSQTTAGEKSGFRQQKIIKATILSTESNAETLRPKTYPERSYNWGDAFSSIVWDNQIAEEYGKEIKPLKEEVRAKLLAKTNNELVKLHLIDALERLGIFYHYEQEIDEILENIFNSISGYEEENKYDLYNTALVFRILRQHGFDISSAIFKKFINDDGTFKKQLSDDPKGLLSLYEAIFLRRHEDDILDKALSFTKSQLKNVASQLNTPLQKQVEHALLLPLHRCYQRTENYYNIKFYEEDESRDENLLKFAKLDFNLLQMLHRQEISSIVKWWDPIITNCDYARDRFVECYYAAIEQHFEPQYSLERIIATKGMALISLLDDTYDVYGTLEELKLFTDAIQRWNYDEIDHVPSKMKLVYKTILNFYQELDEELRKRGRSFALENFKKRSQEYARSQYKETTWLKNGCIPSFEEYLTNGCISISFFKAMPLFLLTAECATEEVFQWLDSNPKFVVAGGIVDRLLDDTATFEDEKARGQLITGIECYMKQYGVSKEEAYAKFHEMIEDAWKDMNEEVSRKSQIPMFVFRMGLNYARAVEAFFRNDINAYLHVDYLIKSEVEALLVKPMNI